MVDMSSLDQAGSRWSEGRCKRENAPYRPFRLLCATALNRMEVAIMNSLQIAGRWIAMVAVCACVLAGCAQLNGAGEGSSSPPTASGSYVFPPPDLQAYD